MTLRAPSTNLVLSLHRAKLGWSDKTVRGVRLVDGRRLAQLVRTGGAQLKDGDVQDVAAEVDGLFSSART